MITAPRIALLALALTLSATIGRAQFRDDFNGSKINGWFTMTGDGSAKIAMKPMNDFVRLEVDARRDQTGVWWTLIKRDVTDSLDIAKLSDPAYELRVEARVRLSDAPRRVNFMVNTNRTVNFHEHLREYDVAEPLEWHVISMTTRNFDAKPGDHVFVQFCVTDWGPERYHVDIDYYRVDVVKREDAGPDLGEPLVYHPEVPPLSSFSHHLGATHDSVLNRSFRDVNFNDWHSADSDRSPVRILTVNGDQWIVMRWDFGALKGAKADGAGVLELTTQSLAIGGKYIEQMGKDYGEEFGMLHVIEIYGGEKMWDQETITYNSFMQGKEYAEVFNPQMTIDLPLAGEPHAKTFFTLPRPVMQRLLDGTTRGLLIRQLGAQSASIYASEDASGNGPVLHFSTKGG